MNRREFLMTSASAGVLLAFGGSAFGKSRERLRVGLIGTGLRGQVHLDELLKRDDVNVTAICDIEKFMLDTALKQFEKAGKRKPRIYTGSDEAWREMIAKAREVWLA